MSKVIDIYKALNIDGRDWPELNRDFGLILENNLKADLLLALNPDQQKELSDYLKDGGQSVDALKTWLEKEGGKIEGLAQKLEESVVKSATDFFKALIMDVDEKKKQEVVELIKSIEI